MVMAFGHKELQQPEATNSLSVISKLLLLLTTIIIEILQSLFFASSHCILLWLKATIIEILQRGYLWPLVITNYYGERIFWPLVTTVYYAQKPEQLRCQREAIRGLWLLQFIMAKVQNH